MVVLAVDGGNSKTDVALVADDGALLAAVRGPTVSHQAVGLDEGMERLGRLAAEVGASVDRPAAVGVFALAGADYPSDVRLLQRGIEQLGIAREVVVVNDTMAALRAGSRRPWGIALICGQGVNGVGVAPDGRVVRFDGVGDISGDWGGEPRSGWRRRQRQSGRGRPRPTNEPREAGACAFRVGVPGAVVRALYSGRVPDKRLGELSPVVFAAAVSGDAVARGIVDRLADELGVMATALIRRLRLEGLDPDVVLAGGVFRAEDPAFHERLAAAVASVAPAARLVRLEAPPVLGSALLALERGAGEVVTDGVVERLAAELTVLGGAGGGRSGLGNAPFETTFVSSLDKPGRDLSCALSSHLTKRRRGRSGDALGGHRTEDAFERSGLREPSPTCQRRHAWRHRDANRDLTGSVKG